VDWHRKDNRVVQYSVEEDVTTLVSLQASGREPLIISNDGSDVRIAYNRGGPWFTIPDGYQYTWEFKHPYNSEFYLNNSTAVTTTVTFQIGGSLSG